MKYKAYWISPYGKIIGVDYKHIDYISRNPEIFKLSKISIEKAYEAEDEPLGLEGRAREKIMTHVLKGGWIRVRYTDKNGWVFQPYKLTKKVKDNIWFLIRNLLEKKETGRYASVYILSVSDQKQMNFTAGGILKGDLYKASEFKKEQKKIIESFKILPKGTRSSKL